MTMKKLPGQWDRLARRPAAVLTDGIGDQIMHWPAVRALADLFPGRLAVNLTEPLAQALSEDLNLRGNFTVPFEEEALLRAGVPPELEDCDLLLVMNDWDSPFLDRLVEIVRPAVSVGYDACCTHVLPRRFARNNVDVGFDLPRFFVPDVAVEDFNRPLRLPAEGEGVARAIRKLVPSDWRVLAVHAETGRMKNLPEALWVEIVDRFLEAHPQWCILLVGRRDNRIHSDASCTERVVPCMGLPLQASMSVVGSADLFLGIDSSMLHIADVQRVPGVGLFGVTDPVRWGFRFALHEHVVAPAHDLRRLRAAEVVAALDRVLGESSGPA